MTAVMLFWTPLTLLQFTVNYVTSFVAQYRGAGQPERVGPAVWQAIYLALATGAVFVSLHFMADRLAEWAGHEPRQQQLEADYFRCLCVAAPAFLLTAAVSGFFAGLGESRTVLLINLIGLVINALLAYAWIFGKWGARELGIAGAGWATVIATSISALAGLALMLRREHRRAYHTLSGWRFDGAMMRRLLRYGLPNGFLGIADTIGFALFVVFVGRMGNVAANATSIAFTLNLFAYLPIMGVAQATGVLVSQRLGEERPDVAERAVWSGLRVALTLTAGISSLFVVIPDWLVAAFQGMNMDSAWLDTAALARTLLLFVVLYCLFDSASMVFSFSLRGAGDTVFVSVGTLSVSLPLMVLPAWLSAHYRWGVYTAWIFASTFPMGCALLFGWRFRRGQWRSLRIIEAPVEA
jgi:MATE family multidrug resistance protein